MIVHPQQILIFVLVFLGSTSVVSQTYFNNYLEPVDSLNPVPSDLLVTDDYVVVQSLHLGNRTVLSILDRIGHFQNDIIFEDFGCSNEGLNTLDDKFVMWGEDKSSDKGLLLQFLDSNFDFVNSHPISSAGVWDFPSKFTTFKGNIYGTYISRDTTTDFLRVHVKSLSSDGAELWETRIHDGKNFVNIYEVISNQNDHLAVTSSFDDDAIGVVGVVSVLDTNGTVRRQRIMSEEIVPGTAVTIVELSNGELICGTVVDKRQEFEYLTNEWHGSPTKYYWLAGSSLQEIKDTIYNDPKLERPGGEKLWKGNGDYFFIYGNVWYVEEDQTYGMLKKVDSDGNILWSRRYQHEDFTGAKNFHGIQKIQEMPDGTIYTSGTAKFSPGRNHIWVMHLDENGCLGSGDCGEVVITDVEEVEPENTIKPVVLYPNPASYIITIDHLDDSLSYTYTITDIVGSVVQSGSTENQKQQTVDVSRYSSGLYFVSIKSGAEFSTIIKFIVKQ